MNKITNLLIITLISSFLAGCVSGNSNNLKVSREFNPLSYNEPNIFIEHPAYKTIIINQPASQVGQVITKAAKNEGFTVIKQTHNTITINKTSVYGNIPVTTSGDATGIVAGRVAFGVLFGALTMGMGGLPINPETINLSQPRNIKAVTGIAKLRPLDGNRTEVKINFNRMYYKYEFKKDKRTFFKAFKEDLRKEFQRPITKEDVAYAIFPFFNEKPKPPPPKSGWGYWINNIEEINNPKIYDFAFKKLQSLPAIMPMLGQPVIK